MTLLEMHSSSHTLFQYSLSQQEETEDIVDVEITIESNEVTGTTSLVRISNTRGIGFVEQVEISLAADRYIV